MINDCSVEIDAPPSLVWAVYADTERWSDWTASIERIVPLQGPQLEIGSRFEIKQPRLPALAWEVTELEVGRSWTWVQRSPGGTTVATHEVVPLDGDRTLVRQRLEQRGPVGVVVAWLMRRTTKRYLHLEAQGLKARSEQGLRHDAPSA